MKVAELCAGYGGLHLSMQAAGWPVELAWVAELDPAAAAVLAAHHPGVPNVGDITAAQFSACEPVDVIACGYPCQPFSVAGKRKGTDDHRWIWPDIARAVHVVRPRLVLLENVPGHLGWGFPEVVGDLAALGYVGSWACVRASDVGAPHRRERLFVVAADAARDPVRPEPIAVGARQHQAFASDHREGTGGVDLLPTPNAALGRGTGFPSLELAQERFERGTRCLDDAVALLPTPTSRDHKGRNQRDDVTCLTGALLPTPTVTNWHGNHVNNRGDVLPPGAVQPTRWGAYGAAVARWEAVLGWPAPDPTELGTRGQPRLSARFVEWMQGLPSGYVTDHVGRNAALRILGNGVVPAQGAHAIAHLTPTATRE